MGIADDRRLKEYGRVLFNENAPALILLLKLPIQKLALRFEGMANGEASLAIASEWRFR